MARNAIGWLQDFMDCADGTHGPEAQRVADEWMEDHADLPNDGTSWQHWRDFRQTWHPAPVADPSGDTHDPR